MTKKVNWKAAVVSPETPIIEAIKILDTTALQIVLAVRDGRLAGTITDGDVRRCLLDDIPVSEPVSHIMCKSPTTGFINEDRETLLALMRLKSLRQIPIVDDNGLLVGLETMLHLIQSDEKENQVVLMAGGQGTRLRPLTEDCPKPLLKVGAKPILEVILETFLGAGFHNFHISVNYKAEMIESHFGDGSRWGANIRYIREDKPLGTAGALSLMQTRPTSPLIVMNGDLLTKVNFSHLLDFHESSGSMATMCVRDYEHIVPFGVVEIDGHRLIGLREKPRHSYYVNAGIYVISPEALDLIPGNEFFDMPTLFERIMQDGGKAAVFPVREYWLDIGRMGDYERAQDEYCKHFDNGD